MSEQRVKRIREGVLLVGVFWRLYVALPTQNVDSFVVSFAIGLMPYAVLVALARSLRPVALVLGGVAVLGLDVATYVAAGQSHSSTAPVATLLVPLFSAVAVVPVVVLGSWLASRVKATRAK